MMRLQRALLRSGAALAGTGVGRLASVLGLILVFVFAVAASGTVGGCVESCVDGPPGVGWPSTTRAARTGVAASGLGEIVGEVCESTAALSADVVGATVCFGEVGAKTDSVVAGGILGALGSVSLVPANIDAMPSAIAPMTGSDHLRATSKAWLDLA